MYRCVTDPKTNDRYGWGRVLDYIGVQWEDRYIDWSERQMSFLRRKKMALKFAIQTAFEILVVVLIIYGFVKEDKLIELEDRIKARIRERANSSRKK